LIPAIFASLLILAVLIVVLTQAGPVRQSPPAPAVSPSLSAHRRATVKINGGTINAEVVDTDQAITQGLSGRKSMGENEGMLFVFRDYQPRSFWMKDMHFPLDFLWINDDHVSDVSHGIPIPPPGAKDGQVPRVSTRSQVNMVMELNSGVARKYNIKAGDRLSIEGLSPGK
jgi:hypothetical protein